MDKDKNGYIDVEEFIEFMSSLKCNITKVFDFID